MQGPHQVAHASKIYTRPGSNDSGAVPWIQVAAFTASSETLLPTSSFSGEEGWGFGSGVGEGVASGAGTGAGVVGAAAAGASGEVVALSLGLQHQTEQRSTARRIVDGLFTPN